VISISIPLSELAMIDQWAARAQMSRSHFLRKATRMLMVTLEGSDPLRGDNL
jgi:metal-responsive CopG/Arc/MetJ family transcriptional regulator